MINKRIVPVVPVSGSLGASGDLAQLARLGCAMMGLKTTMVKYQGQIVSSEFALEREHINKFVPKSKEGLALTNGTTFMASILCVALKRQKEVFE
jgi:histidine ammonia-lyase